MDEGSSFINCDNGQKYKVEDVSYVLTSNKLDDYEDKEARKLCAYGKDDLFSPVPTSINYSLDLKIDNRFAWTKGAKNIFFGLLIVFIVFELIKRTFLYIAAGRPFLDGINLE